MNERIDGFVSMDSREQYFGNSCHSVYSVAAEWDKKNFGAFNIYFMVCGMDPVDLSGGDSVRNPAVYGARSRFEDIRKLV